MKLLSVDLAKTRETKRTIVFEPRDKLAGVECLYVKKSALENVPDTLTITLKTEGA